MDNVTQKYGSIPSEVDVEKAQKFVTDNANKALVFSKEKLLELKKYADDGNWTWRALGFIAGILLVVNGFLSFCYEITSLSPLMAVLNIYLILFGAIFVILEYKDKTCTSRFQEYLKKEALFLYRPYGRGAFYTFCGTLLVCKGGIISTVIGLGVSALGIIIFLVSRQAVTALDSYRKNLIDEKTIEAKFKEFDTDNSGALDSKELAKLCASLGSPLSYQQLESALLLLDKNDDGQVTFAEFLAWWTKKE